MASQQLYRREQVYFVYTSVVYKALFQVKLDAATLKELIESGGNVDETSDTNEDEETKPRLRGSAPKQETDSAENPANEDDKFNMANYDNEATTGPTMKGLAVFTKDEDDPYITSHKDDSEDERDKDAMKIRPDDNLAVVAKFDGVTLFECSRNH